MFTPRKRRSDSFTGHLEKYGKGGKMKFIDVLRKLGIFRSGNVKATYRNGKERPIEFLDAGVFNSKKDLIKFKKKKK